MAQLAYGQPETLDTLVEGFATLIARNGLHAALGFLNGRTRHRFTGVYRFDPPMLRNVALFDRENPTLRLGGDLPMRGSPCWLVGQSMEPYATEDSTQDPRLVDHPAREVVVAYCGVPVIADDGTCFGSLCHFDSRPRIAPLGEIPLLERAAPFVMRVVAQARQLH